MENVAFDGGWLGWLALGVVAGAEVSVEDEYCWYSANEVFAGRAE